MFNNKKIMGITITGVMVFALVVGSISAFASNTDDQKKSAVSPKKSESVQTGDKGLPSHEDLVKLADRYGIDITGKTDDQIEAALKAYKLSHMDEVAVKSDKGDRGKGTTSHESLVETAKECGIDPTGMTDEQIEAAIIAFKQSHSNETADKGIPGHEDLVKMANEFGIDIAGMTDEQIEAAITAFKQSHKGKAIVQTEKGVKVIETSSHEGLVEIANECGIDTAGMTDEQIEAALIAFKRSHDQ